MGGVKNRDEKRKAAKVFSSGGGGSSKGPAIIDKRNQEKQCPHCERVFKQDARLKDHIARQHADKVEPEAGSAASSSAPAAAAASTTANAASASATTSAAANNELSNASSSSSSRPGTAMAGGGSSSSSNAAGGGGGRMMDVGSKGGYFTEKSPKLLLYEWCQQQKRPRPKFKVVAQQEEAGAPVVSTQFRCRVVLPDPKLPGTDKDIVVWLPQQHAAGIEEEAEQRGAIAALHAVAGDRSMDYLLPVRYRPLWSQLGTEAEERAVRAASAKAREQARRDREAQRAQHAARKAPTSIIMSDKQRQMVDGLLKDLHGSDVTQGLAGLSLGNTPSAAAAATSGRKECLGPGQRRILEQLLQLGFQQPDAIAGLRAAAAAAGGDSSSWDATEEEGEAELELRPVLDWLCLHVPESRLPAAFGAGSSRPVSILSKQGAGAAAPTADGSSAAADAAVSCLEDPHVVQLLDWGYPLQPAMAALEEAAGKLQEALQLLYCQLAAEQAEAVATLAAAGDGLVYSGPGDTGEAWEQELEVLDAIYDSQLAVPEEGHCVVSLECDAVTQPVQLLVWCPRGGSVEYPEAPPLLAVGCAELAASVRCHLTQQLAAACSELLGEPMVHTLSVQLQELLQDAQQISAWGSTWPVPFNRSLGATAGQPSQTAGDAAEDGSQEEGAAADVAEQILHRSTSQSSLSGQGRRGAAGKSDRQRGPQLSAAEQAAESKRLQQQQERLQADSSHASMRATRGRLPAAASRGEVLRCVGGAHITIICGATGCGKSTQVPQFLLEEAISQGQGGSTNIIVTQPRRIAALGLASRVANERGEAVGQSVGYSVRLDTKSSSRTRLMFCTTGILLRRLMHDPLLSGVTHIVLDEVHERGLESDLLLMLLRHTLAARIAAATGAGRKGGSTPPGVPKLLLMSATADADLFAEYFRKAPLVPLSVGVLNIPGFTHPVRQLWMEDVLEATGYVVGEKSRYARRKAPAARAGLPSQQQQQPAASGDTADDLFDAEDEDSDALPSGNSSSSSSGPVNTRPWTSYSPTVQRSLQVLDAAKINPDLIEALLVYIVDQMSKKGPAALLKGWQDAPALPPKSDARAVLIFMPGAPEIDALCRQLNSSGRLAAVAGGSSNLRVLPLHGSLPAAQQARVFESVGPGVTKIVVATNVAETSVTIDDIAVVIDTCRLKEMRFDSTRGLSSLQEAWVSQAAAQQRKGRAGRVQPGTCYRLLPSELWTRLAAQQPPEVLRVPLQQLCLATKAALAAAAAAAGRGSDNSSSGSGGDSAAAAGSLFQGLQGAKLQVILSHLLTPPAPDAIEAAVVHLTCLGALAPADESLTPLGRHLVAMPMDADLGKALIYGCMLRCAGPLLTIAAAAAYGRPVWVSPGDKRAMAEAAKKAVAAAAYTQRSDHLAVVAAYNGWLAARAAGGKREAQEYCNSSFLSYQAMESIHASRLDYAATLTSLGFLPDWYTSHLKQEAVAGPTPVKGQTLTGQSMGMSRLDAFATTPGGPDEYSHNARVVKAALVAGFYPRILRVETPPAKYAKVEGGAMRTEHEARQLKFFDRRLGRVFLHPSSCCFPAGSFPSGWLVYSQLVETAKAYVREASMVPVYGLLMCGGELEVQHTEGLLVLDGWARFKAPARIGVLLQQLRAAVAALLAAKVETPGLDLAGHRVVDALHALLATDGF